MRKIRQALTFLILIIALAALVVFLVGAGWRSAMQIPAHTQAWDIPPSGNKLNWIGHCIFRIDDGKIVEDWYLEDNSALFQQLGFKLVPPKE